MKTLKFIGTVLSLTVVIFSCKDINQPEIKTVEVEVVTKAVSQDLDSDRYTKVEFGIEGMTCAMGCAKTIEKKIAKLEGVKMAKVDFDKRMAMVTYDEAKVNLDSLKEAVAKVGSVYKVKDMKIVENFSAINKVCKATCKKKCCTNGGKKKMCTKKYKKRHCGKKKNNE